MTKRLRNLGISNMRVDRSTLEFSFNYYGLNAENKKFSKEDFNKKIKQISENQLKQHLSAFLNDTRDTTTPNAMVKLLALIYQGKALKPKSTQLLLNIMSRKSPEVGRLYFYLPKNIKVSEKLGTSYAVVNDVGIIKLPDNQGTIVLAIYSKFVPDNEIIKHKVPAQIAKTFYDFFMFNSKIKTYK